MSVKDYLANLKLEPGDKLDHGVVGMKWGIRRSSAALRSAAASRKASAATAKTDHVKNAAGHEVLYLNGTKENGGKPVLHEKATGKLHEINKDGSKGAHIGQMTSKPKSNIQDHVESSHDRYSRLAAEAKAGRADKMTEQDLKFFNARTEALAKVNKLNEQKPGWLADTSKKVLQQTAQNSMQSIADGVAKKYISGPVIEAINKKSST